LTCSKTIATSARLIEDQISRLKFQFKQRLLAKEETTAVVSTLLQSDQIAIEHKTEILNKLEAYRIELNKSAEAEDVEVVVSGPVTAVDCEEPVIVEEVNKIKRKRLLFQLQPIFTRIHSDSIKFNIASNGKSLSRLFAELEMNAYDNKLRVEAPINLFILILYLISM
jgi:hypothetical protein